MRTKLDSFLNPKTIAIIGASNNPMKVGGILMKKLDKFKGKIIPVNKKEFQIRNKLVYKKIIDYPGKIDLAVIATPRKAVKKILKEIIKKKIKNVIIITAGFSEIGNKKEEREIISLAKKNKLNLLGPNCFGIVNPKINLDLTFAKETPKKGNTVFISQSGALESFIADLNIPLRAAISLGNMADLTFCDFIDYFEDDKNTKKIVLYVEKIKEGRRFIDLCKVSKKEIIVVKAGRSNKGKKATMSHTGSLATNFEIYKGAFKQAKIKYKNSLTSAFSLRKENYIKKINGKNILVVTNAGGAGALVTDELEEKGFKVFGPKDLLGTATAKDYLRFIEKISSNYDKIIVILTPQIMSNPEGVAEAISNSSKKEKIIALFLGDISIKKAKKILKENKIPVFTKAV